MLNNCSRIVPLFIYREDAKMADNFRPMDRQRQNRVKQYDPLVHAQTTIDSAHRMIHDGFFFNTSGKETGWTNGTTKEFLISPPAGCYPHVQAMVLNFGRGDIDFEAYEGPTITDNGTALTVRNVNRNSDNTPDLDLYASPTTTDDGTMEFQLWVPPTSTGTGQSSNGIEGVGQGSEWILKPSTPWLVRLTNNSGATIDWSYEFSWYEIGYED